MKRYPSTQMYLAVMTRPLYGPRSVASEVVLFEHIAKKFEEEEECTRPTESGELK